MPARLIRTLLLALVALALFGAAPAAAVETGINETRRPDEADRRRPPPSSAPAGCGIWASWETLQPSPGALAPRRGRRHEALASTPRRRKGLKVLMVVQRTPAWASGGSGATSPPADPATFGAAMGGLAQRRPRRRRLGAVERGGRAQFFWRRPEPAKYAAMVKSAYPAIKAAQPNDIVVTGGPSRTTSTSSRRSTRTASRATSTRSASTRTPPAWSTAPDVDLPRRAGPDRPLHVHRLPRGPRA